MLQPNISIVIPHYNIPQLLIRCINSIPIREDIQVIVVDDCSNRADKYIETYPELSRPFLEFYTTPKGGSAGRARNVGIEHAKGIWLTFIDADDLFVCDVDKLFDKYKDCSEDILYFQSKSVMCDDVNKSSDRNIFLYHFDHYFKTGDDKPLRYEFDAPWGKLVKKKLIDQYHIRFDEVRYSNDTFFSAAIGVYAKTVKVINEVLYIVTERHGSLTSIKNKSLEEWLIRYYSALKVQMFFDEHQIRYRRYAFVDLLQNLWKSNKKISFIEFCKLSLHNKCRVLYCLLRNLI